jgi:hypothetical protein
MLAMPLLMLAALTTQEAPRFTDGQVREAIACANQSAGQCAPDETRSAAIACLATPRAMGVDVVDGCIAEITDRCLSKWSATTSQMNTRVVLTCGAETSAALREAADDWLDRSDGALPAAMITQYRELRSSVPARIQTQSAGQEEIEASGIQAGVWASFVKFIWQQQWQHRGLAD